MNTSKLFLSLLFFINLVVNAQNIDETIISADKMFKKEDYTNALSYYKRVLFFSSENQEKLFSRCGDCCFMMKDYQTALNYYDSAFLSTDSLQLLSNLTFKKVDCLIFSKKYKDAEQLILSSDLINNSKQLKKKNFYLGIIYFSKNDYANSEKYFLSSLNDTALIAKSEIQKVFKKKKFFLRPNPKVAGALSLIVPGSGQLYSGDYKNALNSFLLVAVFTAIGTDLFIRYAWYDSLISISPWFFRYYIGGSENAVKIAEQRRNKKRNDSLNKIIQITQK